MGEVLVEPAGIEQSLAPLGHGSGVAEAVGDDDVVVVDRVWGGTVSGPLSSGTRPGRGERVGRDGVVRSG